MAVTSGTTYNTDVFGIVRRINRFIEEIFLSASSGVSRTSSFDVNRAKSYIGAIRTYVTWVTSQPELDLPETGPRSIALPANPVIPTIENESLFDLAILFELGRDEVANSQSSRLSSNLIKFDKDRLIAILDKADAFIANYIQTVDPLDLPESSPAASMSGAGRTGV
jgi:hypothetical protein